jgi:hypothetical protein
MLRRSVVMGCPDTCQSARNCGEESEKNSEEDARHSMSFVIRTEHNVLKELVFTKRVEREGGSI